MELDRFPNAFFKVGSTHDLFGIDDVTDWLKMMTNLEEQRAERKT